ncbi:MAG: hypothetical protein EA352_09490 [Gemmatimonadales bacterium]|nr:MAG: hypothetical protein EA352_09490 [Gemmatimonadales bacterium]
MSRSHESGSRRNGPSPSRFPCDDVPGIVIQDGGRGLRASMRPPRVHAFVYGEKMPSVPTLPFGRWKAAS